MKPAFPKIESRAQRIARQLSPLVAQTIRHYIGTTESKRRKILLKHLLSMKKKGEPISMVTAYDYNQGKLADEAGVDTVLVGDSCAQVMLGYKSTNQITMDAIVHHTRSVANAIDRAYLIGDMPFGSYLTRDDAVRNASRIIGEGGANAVKLEGFIPDAVEAISKFVPVVGHLGLLPQTADCFGTRGRTFSDILQLKEESLRLQDAGCSMLVLEKVCAETCLYITQLLDIPTIGIASGVHSDGQVLVWHDLLGLNNINAAGNNGGGSTTTNEGAPFKFVKEYCNLAPVVVGALKDYVSEVKSKQFPKNENSFFLSNKTKEKFKTQLATDYALATESDDDTGDNEGENGINDNGERHIGGNLIDPVKFWDEFDKFYGSSDNDQDFGGLSGGRLDLKIPKISEIGVGDDNNNNNSKKNINKNAIKIIKSPKELRKHRTKIEKEEKQVIFVPFLGGLHEGHLKLIEKAKEEKELMYEKHGILCEIWTSLFLNPTQFNDESDLAKYPMVIEDDIKALEKTGCVDVIFQPKKEDMYVVADSHFRPFMQFTSLYDKCEEAKQRQGHFEGVATVVTKLFAWIRPQKAIFGQKDFMQTVIISRLCDEFFGDTEIVVYPTVRSKDGLALSSRNRKLNENEVVKAPMIYDCLCCLAGIIFEEKRVAVARTATTSVGGVNGDRHGGYLTVGELKQFGEVYCISKGIDLEYISFHEFETGFALSDDFNILKEFLNGANKRKYVISIAGSVGPSTRLIDNIVIAPNSGEILKELKIPCVSDILVNIPDYGAFREGFFAVENGKQALKIMES